MADIIEKFKNNKISKRQLIYKAKNEFSDEIISNTSFIETDDIVERLFYLINDITEEVKCPYCGKKAKWTGRLNEGYKTTCCSKECESKRISEAKNGTSISENRDQEFIDWQKNVKHVDDSVIKDNIRYSKQIDLIDNENIIKYLSNRYDDSSSIHESYKRIILGIDKKPLCPTCGKPVVFIGKKSKMFTTYCSDKCTQRNQKTIEKKKRTQLENWGSENCYDSEKYKSMMKDKYGVEYSFQRKEIKDKRKQTLINHYGTTKLFSVKEIRDKIKKTNLNRNCDFTEDMNVFRYSHEDLMDEFNFYKKLYSRELKGMTKKNLIIKHFLGNIFYKNEINIFVNDPIKRRKIIQNRCKFLNKKENELTVDDIIRGFKESGIYYGYSHFNPAWTNWFVHKFSVDSVYDPCGGWGHHMLGMLQCKKIIYNDFSKETYNGVCKIKDYFNIAQLECHNNDAREFIPENVDAFFMCPPYYNLEHYECGDFTSIDEYKEFLNKIFKIWKMNEAKIFGLILREEYEELIDEDYSEKFEMKVTVSHLTKNKRYREFFYIYKKQ